FLQRLLCKSEYASWFHNVRNVWLVGDFARVGFDPNVDYSKPTEIPPISRVYQAIAKAFPEYVTSSAGSATYQYEFAISYPKALTVSQSFISHLNPAQEFARVFSNASLHIVNRGEGKTLTTDCQDSCVKTMSEPSAVSAFRCEY